MQIIQSKYNSTIDTTYLIIMISMAFAYYWEDIANPTQVAKEMIINKPFKEDGEYERLTTPYQFEELSYADCDDKVIEYLSAQYAQYGYKMDGIQPIGAIIIQPIGENTFTHICNMYADDCYIYELDLTYPERYGLTNHTAIEKLLIVPNFQFYKYITSIHIPKTQRSVPKTQRNEEYVIKEIVKLYEVLLDKNELKDYFLIMKLNDELNPLQKDTIYGF